MDSNLLYQSCLKMLNDKYNINDFSKDIFFNIYSNIYKNAGTTIPNNDLNKAVLIEIKTQIENNINNNNNNNIDIKDKNEDLELKIKEMEALRSSIAKMNITIQPSQQLEIESQPAIISNQQPIKIITYQQPLNINKFKTFIVNTTKNNFRIITNIDIKYHVIYPCSICIPTDIKNKTPYLILVLSDGIKQINYTYIPNNVYNSIWDIWNPIIDNYIDITLTNNNWIITLIDYLNNPIDLNEYHGIVNDVLLVDNNYILNINNIQYFSINDRIKIVKNNGHIVDNIINNIDDNTISINKNKLNLDDFIESKIINYKHNISITFKYHLKQEE